MQKINILKKEALNKIKEEDVLFITIPGRMGDEDEITLVIKQEDKYNIYRINGLMYSDGNMREKDNISLNDIIKQFPKWFETWQNSINKDYKGKYTCLYMGFGNGLCIDNSIYDDFKPYLDKKVKAYLESYHLEDRDSLKYGAIFNVWDKALLEMISNKKTR